MPAVKVMYRCNSSGSGPTSVTPLIGRISLMLNSPTSALPSATSLTPPVMACASVSFGLDRVRNSHLRDHLRQHLAGEAAARRRIGIGNRVCVDQQLADGGRCGNVRPRRTAHHDADADAGEIGRTPRAQLSVLLQRRNERCGRDHDVGQFARLQFLPQRVRLSDGERKRIVGFPCGDRLGGDRRRTGAEHTDFAALARIQEGRSAPIAAMHCPGIIRIMLYPCMVRPPDTLMVWPVMNFASSLSRKAMMPG